MKKKLLIMGGALACLAGVGGIMAYFTDTDEAENNFTIGNIQIDLQEPTWERLPDTDGDQVPDDAEDMVPGDSVAKDPQIKNVGTNDAYMFLEVKVPYANVVIANPNGTKNAAADTELFSYTVKTGWVEVGQPTKDATTGIVTHVYAYATNGAMTAVAKDAITTSLFDSVALVNLIEGQKALDGVTPLDPSAAQINIKAYAIQTDNVNGGVTAPADVWTVVNNQVNTATPEAPAEG